MFWSAAAIFVVGLMFWRSRSATRKREAEREADTRAAFNAPAARVGQSLDFLVAKAGPWTSGGALDFGIEVYEWRAGRFVAEVWFKNGLCTEIRDLSWNP